MRAKRACLSHFVWDIKISWNADSERIIGSIIRVRKGNKRRKTESVAKLDLAKLTKYTVQQ